MKKGIIIGSIVLIIAATVAVCFAITGGVFNPLESHIKLAVKYFQDGKYEEAILEFDKAIAINDKLTEVYLAKASAEIYADNENAANESVLRAIDLMKNNDEEENDKITEYLKAIIDNAEYRTAIQVVLWWYDRNYENEEYSEYIKWLEEHLTDYEQEFAKIREKYDKQNDEKYLSLYDEILSEYKTAEENNYEYDYINGELLEEVYPNVNPEVVSSGNTNPLYYAFFDINNDNINELIIAKEMSDSIPMTVPANDRMNIYDMYTCTDKATRLFDVYTMGYRAKYAVYSEGIIGCLGDGGVSAGGHHFYKLNSNVDDGDIITDLEDLSWEDDGEKIYFITKNGAKTQITEEEYNKRINKYEIISNIEWNLLSEYKVLVSETNGTGRTQITEEEAARLVSEKTGGTYSLALDSENDTQFVFRHYENTADHTATLNWYYVDKKTGEVTSMF